MEMQSEIVLFDEKEKCCGCGACMNACPKNAISMQEDAYGFLYPQIDADACIKCGACQRACRFQHKTEEHIPVQTFAACVKSDSILKHSASGGAFTALAQATLAKGGIVFGAAFDETWKVCHISIDSEEGLSKLQGSKYVQSNIAHTYQQVKKLLKEGKRILYSGTPCQIAGLYGYLGKDDENLLTADLICHGVPNQRMLQDYLKSLGEVTYFTFRDKSLGWGINGRAIVKGQKKPLKLWRSASPYLYYFSQGLIYRDSCYQCKYTCQHRPADITLGDYWGIEKQHPDYLGKNGFDSKKGISVMIANTEKGAEAIRCCAPLLDLRDSTFEKASAGNTQLVRPTEKKTQRQEILTLYAQQGWDAVAERFSRNIGFRKHSSVIKAYLPVWCKQILKRMK